MAITREHIWSAADQMDQAGEKPTLAAVRKRLGGGSYTTISEAMTEWHSQRASRRATTSDPVPERVGEAAAELTTLVWQVAVEIAEGRMQAERAGIEETRQRMQAEKTEAATFADQLGQELETVKGRLIELTGALEVAGSKLVTLQGERDSERSRADRLDAVASERQKMVDALRDELAQVRKDKDAEISRLVAAKAKMP